jgi:hypothetical protein
MGPAPAASLLVARRADLGMGGGVSAVILDEYAGVFL